MSLKYYSFSEKYFDATSFADEIVLGPKPNIAIPSKAIIFLFFEAGVNTKVGCCPSFSTVLNEDKPLLDMIIKSGLASIIDSVETGFQPSNENSSHLLHLSFL